MEPRALAAALADRNTNVSTSALSIIASSPLALSLTVALQLNHRLRTRRELVKGPMQQVDESADTDTDAYDLAARTRITSIRDPIRLEELLSTPATNEAAGVNAGIVGNLLSNLLCRGVVTIGEVERGALRMRIPNEMVARDSLVSVMRAVLQSARTLDPLHQEEANSKHMEQMIEELLRNTQVPLNSNFIENSLQGMLQLSLQYLAGAGSQARLERTLPPRTRTGARQRTALGSKVQPPTSS